ncbi:MAG TPA: ABC transporter substrate-binding protein [Chloroflexaceae bacterium]|nr:ABC transporter substrate-binding protein [Chloroflexaceae bacterium]
MAQRPKPRGSLSLLTALIAGLALLVSACGGAAPAQPGAGQPTEAPAAPAAPPPTTVPATAVAAAPQASSKSRLVFSGNQEPASIDVVTMSGNVNEREVAGQIFETLVYMDQSQTVYPGLALEWERSEDATEWTFTLAEGVTWHDGTPFNAQAVADYFTYVRDNPVGTGPGQIKPVIGEAEAVDDTTVRLTLTAPRPDFLIELADPGLGIGNIANLEARGQDAGFNPVGTGPFKFREWVRGSEIVLERNPDWAWASPMFNMSGPPLIEELVFRFTPEAQTRLATLEAGEVDFVDLLPFQDVARVREDARFAVSGFLLPGMPQMNYMNTQLAPTDDLNVRKAIIYATDKQGIIESVYFNMVEPAYGPLSRAFPEYEPALEQMYEYNPERAMELLDEAGWAMGADGVREKDGQRLAVTIVENKSWNDWVYVLQANLQAVGFDAQVLTTQGPSNTEAIVSGEYQVPAMGDVFAAASQMTRDWHSEGFGTFPSGHFLASEELDGMLKAAETELDPERRKQMYSDIQTYIMENALMVPIFELYFYAAHANNLKGFIVDGTGFYKYFASAYFE